MRLAAATLAIALLWTLVPVVPSAIAIAAGCDTPGTPTTTVYLPNITKTLGGPGGWVTPFIVQNVGSAAATLEVSFYRFSDGSLVTCRKVAGLAPGTSFADVPNNDTDLPADSQFAVVVRSFGSQVVSVVNEHQGAGERAEALSYVGLTSGATKVALPYVAKAVGGWVTTFIIQNLGTATATATVAFTSYDGTKTATLTRTIGPGRSQVVDATVEAAVAAGLEHSVLVTSTQPVAVVVNAHNDAPTALRPMGFSYNAVDADRPGTYAPYASRNTDGIARTSRIIVQNTGTADTTPVLTFRRIGQTGSAAVTAPSPVKPGRSWSFDPRFQADGTTACAAAGGPTCVAEGEHSVVVSGGTFATLVIASSPATAMGYTAGSPTTQRMYLANVTRTLGGAIGWTTPLLIQSAGATSATLRWYRFADGGLAVTQYVPGLTSGASVRVDPRQVSGLTDGTQYAVVLDAPGSAHAIVVELATGGDGAMIYEGAPATGTVTAAPAPTVLTLSPATASVALGKTQQLTVTVKDQSGNAMTGVPITWSVTPAPVGTINASGLFTAGSAPGSGTLTAAFGSLSATASVTTFSATVTIGGFTFNVRATATSDVYTESTITTADAQTVAVAADADVAQVVKTYGRTFATRPPIYVFPTTATYTTGLETVLLIPAADARQLGSKTTGVFGNRLGTYRVALNWQDAKEEVPLITLRHELTHMMIEDVAKPTRAKPVPAWLNEGSATLEEFTVPRTKHLEVRYRYGAASMVATKTALTVADLTDQDAWNARSGDVFRSQYREASQLVRLLREDIGVTSVTRILEVMGGGQVFEQAYTTVTGKAFSAFAANALTRLQAIAPFYPGIATADDEPGGVPGLSYVLYGFTPNSTVRFDVLGQSTRYENTIKTRTVDPFGVVFSYFGPGWPADTYSLTATGPSVTISPATVAVNAVKAVTSAVEVLRLLE